MMMMMRRHRPPRLLADDDVHFPGSWKFGLVGSLVLQAPRVEDRCDGDRHGWDTSSLCTAAASLSRADLTFRTFRNEGLEQYHTLFDLASRYTYLAAKNYDYETGLLGTPAGQSVISGIVAARALGDITNGVPQSTVSTLGDAGLAGTMAQLQADFSVAEGRLGINNPDSNGTLFSLRHELYRILNDPASTADDDMWQQTLEQHITANVMADPDVAAYCRNIKKTDGSAVPGIVIPFSTTIQHEKNFFGLDYAAGYHKYTPSNYATKIYSVGIVLPGYVGMDPYAIGTPNAGSPNSTSPNALGPRRMSILSLAVTITCWPRRSVTPVPPGAGRCMIKRCRCLSTSAAPPLTAFNSSTPTAP